MPVMIENTNYYTIKEIADKFGCSTRTIKRYIDADKIEGKKLGRSWYFTEKNIEDYFSNNLENKRGAMNE
nr:MAG TPA: helix-turn-helix domain protein [Caudoviricetes sp.]